MEPKRCACEHEAHFECLTTGAHGYGHSRLADGRLTVCVTDYGTDSFCSWCRVHCFEGFRCDPVDEETTIEPSGPTVVSYGAMYYSLTEATDVAFDRWMQTRRRSHVGGALGA
jgi:hypothetical protein